MVLGYESFVPLYILFIWNYFEAPDLFYQQNQVKVPNFATCFILMNVSDKNEIDLTNTSVVVFSSLLKHSTKSFFLDVLPFSLIKTFETNFTPFFYFIFCQILNRLL